MAANLAVKTHTSKKQLSVFERSFKVDFPYLSNSPIVVSVNTDSPLHYCPNSTSPLSPNPIITSLLFNTFCLPCSFPLTDEFTVSSCSTYLVCFVHSCIMFSPVDLVIFDFCPPLTSSSTHSPSPSFPLDSYLRSSSPCISPVSPFFLLRSLILFSCSLTTSSRLSFPARSVRLLSFTFVRSLSSLLPFSSRIIWFISLLWFPLPCVQQSTFLCLLSKFFLRSIIKFFFLHMYMLTPSMLVSANFRASFPLWCLPYRSSLTFSPG